jgi:hypothetical protein
VRYTVKPGQEGVNEKPVRVVYDELRDTPADRRGGPDRQLPPVRQLNQKRNTMTTSNTTAAGTSQDSATRAVFAQTSRVWADGDGGLAAWYAPDATVILPGVYLPGQDAIRKAMAAVGLFISRGDPRLLGRILAAYGRSFDPRELLAYTLLHVHSNLPECLSELPAPPEPTLDSLALTWFGTT